MRRAVSLRYLPTHPGMGGPRFDLAEQTLPCGPRTITSTLERSLGARERSVTRQAGVPLEHNGWRSATITSSPLSASEEAIRREDTDLVARSLDGDLSAFNLIVERYRSRVFNLAARIVGDRTAAEDVAQETFISAYKALSGFRGGSLRAWLIRISSNTSYDFIRASRRKPQQSLDQSMLNPGFRPPTGGVSPEQAALSSELRVELQKAIMTLPPDQRTTLVLIDVQGLSYDEAAESMDVSIGTVKSRLARSRSKVKERLLENRDLLPEEFRQIKQRK